jgi:hypothetical protein
VDSRDKTKKGKIGAPLSRVVYFIVYHRTFRSLEDKVDLQFIPKVRDQTTDLDQELLAFSHSCNDQAMFKHMRWKEEHLLRGLRKD